MKKHIRPVTHPKLAFSQIEPLLQLVGLKQAIVSFPRVVLGNFTDLLAAISDWREFVEGKTT